LSFVSSSTGYSSARSSLRSSEISDDSPLNAGHSSSNDIFIGRKLLARETSLSEVRRLKLVSSGTVSQLDRIAMELLETERSYVNDLNDVIQVISDYLATIIFNDRQAVLFFICHPASSYISEQFRNSLNESI
uniref:DH domain-containing protein n=1 Tax=Gongylonema pulchrum TaxID=637853 RepID=A0A183ETN3_9BILA